MERYELNEKDKMLIETALAVLKENFDDGVYNHTVGCAILCKNGIRTDDWKLSCQFLKFFRVFCYYLL